MYDYGKRIAGLAAFVVVSSALFPIWLPSQSAMQYQLNDNTRQLQALAAVPTDIAVLKNDIGSLRRDMSDTRASVDSLKNTGTVIVLGMLGWFAKELFEMFGGKFGKGRP